MLSTLLDTALALALVPSRVLGLFSLALALVLSQAQDRREDFTERVKCEADEFTDVLASSVSAKTVRRLHMVIRPCAPMMGLGCKSASTRTSCSPRSRRSRA